MKTLLDSIKDRRSIYSFGNNESIDSEKIITLIKDITKYVPSAFNMESQRVVLLLNEEHHKVWNITLKILEGIVTDPKAFEATKNKVENSFISGFGTVLYFEDTKVVEKKGDSVPAFKHNFDSWSVQGNAMLQYGIWLTLTSAGYGASVQHYNPLIDDEVKKTWNIPASWKLIAQMPFGNIKDQPQKKTFMPLDDKIKVYK